MTEPTPPRPVPGPLPGDAVTAASRAVGAAGAEGTGAGTSGVPAADAAGPGAHPRFADLTGQPVAEHVGVFEAEHARLQAELATIDRL